MIFIFCLQLLLVCLAVAHAATQQQSATKENKAQNKTKRGLSEQQSHTFHDVDSFKPLILYPELAAAGASHSETYAETPKSFAESEPPKQVTAQQVLYEYQQTPSTTISNVHVNQQFQTVPTAETANSQVVYASQLPPAASATQFVNDGHNLEAQQNQQHSVSVQNVVHPVQHSALIKHGQNYGQISLHTPPPQAPPPPPRNPAPVYQPPRNVAPPPTPVNQYVSSSVQPTQSSFYSSTQNFAQQPNLFSPGKYLYVNGKILYYPQGIPTTPIVPSTPYPGTIAKHPAVSYQNHQVRPLAPAPPKPTRRPIAAPTPTITSTQYYNTFLPKKVVATTQKPPVAPVTEAQQDEEEEDEEPEQKPKARPVEDDEEDDDDEDDRPIRYLHDDEDDDDDEDEYERPTKYVPKYYTSKYLSPSIDKEEEEEDEDENDSDREQSKHVKQKTKKPKKYYKGDIYLKPTKDKNKFQNSKYFVFFDPLKEDPKKAYAPRSEPEPKYSKLYASYKTPQKKVKSKSSKSDTSEEPQMEYTVYKYHKVEPQKEDNEGRFSENVPVIHTQKVIKKQWLVTKTDE